MTRERLKALSSRGPEQHALPFGPAPLLEGEDSAAYDELLMRVSAAVKPADILEEMYVRDIVDLQWEVLRLRRLKAAMLDQHARGILGSWLQQYLRDEVSNDHEDPDYSSYQAARERGHKLVQGWMAREPKAVKKINSLLAAHSDSILNDLPIRAFCDSMDELERIEQLTAIAESRRNRALREIDLRRTAFASTLRRTMAQIEEANSPLAAQSSGGEKSP